MSGHGPTPWFHEGRKVFDQKGDVVASTQTPSAARMIVQSVNFFVKEMQRKDEGSARRERRKLKEKA